METRGRIHFIGIGGHGMSSLARVMLEMGTPVSGSDMSDSPRTRGLRAIGADVRVGHDPRLVEGAELVVVSSAVPAHNVELEHAHRLGITTVTRAQMLARLMNGRLGVAITGTHGKTTTSSMVATILVSAGLDPTVVLGEEAACAPGGARSGRSDLVVAEADEAYGSFLELRPRIAVVTNVDDDHLDYYGSPDAIDRAFLTFLSSVPEDGLAVMCADDARLMSLDASVRCRKTLYGLTAGDLVAERLVLEGWGYSFDAVLAGRSLGRLVLGVPGRHNVANALAALAVAIEVGVPVRVVRDALAGFRGARRRCEVIGDVRGVLVMDDYAHHPTEIRTTLAALKESSRRRLIVVFQPQRFTRTKLLFDEFVRAFSPADVVVITEIYYTGTGEEPIPGIDGRRLASAIEERQGKRVLFVEDVRDIASQLLSRVQPGDLVVTMGAGNVDAVARELVQRMGCDWAARS